MAHEIKITESLHMIAYIDFLATKEKTANKQLNIAETFNKIYHEIDDSINGFNRVEAVGFKMKFFSDNVILAFEISNEYETRKNQFQLFFSFVEALQYSLLKDFRLLCRGGITFGSMYMDESFLIGEAIDKAFYLESKVALYPRIVVNNTLVKYCHKLGFCIETILRRDFDGEYFIDYLNKGGFEERCAVGKIIDGFYEESSKGENIDTRVSQKINWMQNYCKLDLAKFICALSNAVEVLPTAKKGSPLYSFASCGEGEIADGDVQEYFFPPEKISNRPNDITFVRVKGDSMANAIFEGDVVQVKKSATANSGDIVLALVESESGGHKGFVKTVRYEKDLVRLVSENKKYEDMVFAGDEVYRLHIIGVVENVIRSIGTIKETAKSCQLFN